MKTASPPSGSSLKTLCEDASRCRACHLWKNATQTVFGEGPQHAQIMLVGEQPGDKEDLAGKPFVGPAALMLDRALQEAGIDRKKVYVTNAVKHFKVVMPGHSSLLCADGVNLSAMRGIHVFHTSPQTRHGWRGQARP